MLAFEGSILRHHTACQIFASFSQNLWQVPEVSGICHGKGRLRSHHFQDSFCKCMCRNMPREKTSIDENKIGGVLLNFGDRHVARGFSYSSRKPFLFCDFESARKGGRRGPPAGSAARAMMCLAFRYCLLSTNSNLTRLCRFLSCASDRSLSPILRFLRSPRTAFSQLVIQCTKIIT